MKYKAHQKDSRPFPSNARPLELVRLPQQEPVAFPPEGCARGIGSVIHGVWMSSPERGQANMGVVTVSPETRASHPYPRDGANWIQGTLF